jgi:hypothetical protein
MKRKIEVIADGVRIVATLDTGNVKHRNSLLRGNIVLTRNEVEHVRDELADRLQNAASDLTYIGTPRNRVKVC